MITEHDNDSRMGKKRDSIGIFSEEDENTASTLLFALCIFNPSRKIQKAKEGTKNYIWRTLWGK